MARDVSAIVLAGGQSRRLGIDKTALRIGGQTLLARTVELLARVCREVIVVTSTPAQRSQPTLLYVTDTYPGKGVLSAIHAGLVSAQSPYCLAVAADMPFLNADLLGYLTSLAPGYDVVVPVIDGQFEPLHAVYSRQCIPFIQRRLEADSSPRVISFFGEVSVGRVSEEEMAAYDPTMLSLFNINTPVDLERARRLLSERGLNITIDADVTTR